MTDVLTVTIESIRAQLSRHLRANGYTSEESHRASQQALLSYLPSEFREVLERATERAEHNREPHAKGPHDGPSDIDW